MINKENLTRDYLPGTDIFLYQDPKMFRVNTDTHLLGNFLKVKKGETVLDIGVNNGALLLYANQYHPAKMIGVDIQENACNLAKLNMQDHQIENVEIYCSDIREFTDSMVDVIVCNPPYFNEENTNLNVEKRIARNEIYLPLSDLFQAIRRLLKEKGRCYLIHRVNRLNEIYRASLENNLNIREMTLIYDENHDYAHGILMEIVKGHKVHLKVNKSIEVKR